MNSNVFHFKYVLFDVFLMIKTGWSALNWVLLLFGERSFLEVCVCVGVLLWFLLGFFLFVHFVWSCIVLFFPREEELCSYLLGSPKHWSLQFYLYGTACTMNAAAS